MQQLHEDLQLLSVIVCPVIVFTKIFFILIPLRGPRVGHSLRRRCMVKMRLNRKIKTKIEIHIKIIKIIIMIKIKITAE